MILVMVNTIIIIIIIIIFNNLIHTYAETPFRRMLICENSGLGEISLISHDNVTYDDLWEKLKIYDWLFY